MFITIEDEMVKLGDKLGLKYTISRKDNRVNIFYNNTPIDHNNILFTIEINKRTIEVRDEIMNKQYKTIGEIEKRLKNTIIMKKENQQYLTEPYDPEFSLEFKHNADTFIKEFDKQINALCVKYDLYYEVDYDSNFGVGYMYCISEKEGETDYDKICHFKLNVNLHDVRIYNQHNEQLIEIKQLENEIKEFFKK
jgi:uncharacterized protein YueI